MKVTLSKEVEFDTGHRVPDHKSKCFNPHGHRYKVVATVVGEVIDEAGASDNGMVVDFSDLKAWLTTEVHDQFDHAFVVYDRDEPMLTGLLGPYRDNTLGWKIVVVPFIPTAENFAASIFARLEPVIAKHWRDNMRLQSIEVYETPTSVARYERQ